MADRTKRNRKQPIQVYPTLAGWLFLAVAVMVGLAAAKTQAALTYVLFGGMMGAMAISAIIARQMVAAVALDRESPDRVWQDQTAHLNYNLRNLRRRSCMAMKVEEAAVAGVEFSPGYCLHLRPGASFRCGARFAPRRRGAFVLERIRLSTSFPFGLVRACRAFEQKAGLTVWPGRGKLRRQLLHRGAAETSSAGPSPVQGGQDEFFGLRQYRAGDNPRWIHWRRSAGRIMPVVREMSRPLPEILWVVLDVRPASGAPEDCRRRERTIRFASTLIDHAFAKGYKVGLAMAGPGGAVVHEPAPGLGQRCLLLDALARIDAGPAEHFAETVGRLQRHRLREAQVAIIAADKPALEACPLRALQGACRGLKTFCADQLQAVFEDDPLAGQEQA